MDKKTVDRVMSRCRLWSACKWRTISNNIGNRNNNSKDYKDIKDHDNLLGGEVLGTKSTLKYLWSKAALTLFTGE